MNHILHRAIATLTLALLSTGFVFAAEHEHAPTPNAPAITSAVAVLLSSNNAITGTIKFTQEAGGVRVEVDVKGLTPGVHGFHIHEKGDLSKSDFTSAGPHFNPEGHKHAARTDTDRHAGDLGNLEAGADGHATANFVDATLQLSGPRSIIGRSVVIHGKADDLKSQPAGDAGPRIAAGVIGVAN